MRNQGISLMLAMTVVAALSGVACDDDNGDHDKMPLQPTRISSAFVPVFPIDVRPTRLARRSIPGAVCPSRQPFLVPVELLIANTSGSQVALDRVGFQFFDTMGAAGPQSVTLQPNLARQFGTVGLPPQTSRMFPFSVEFGCGTGATGTLSVLIGTINTDGVRHERKVDLAID
jgi:hypothetical protein